jgi:hypothetical protein
MQSELLKICYGNAILLLVNLLLSVNSFQIGGRFGGISKNSRVSVSNRAKIIGIHHTRPVMFPALKLRSSLSSGMPNSASGNDPFVKLQEYAVNRDCESFCRYFYWFAQESERKRDFLHPRILKLVSSMILSLAPYFSELELTNVLTDLSFIGYTFRLHHDRFLLVELVRLYLHQKELTETGALNFFYALYKIQFDWKIYDTEILQLIEDTSSMEMDGFQLRGLITSIAYQKIPWRVFNKKCQGNIMSRIIDILNRKEATVFDKVTIAFSISHLNGFTIQEISKEYSSIFLKLILNAWTSINWNEPVETLHHVNLVV